MNDEGRQLGGTSNGVGDTVTDDERRQYWQSILDGSPSKSNEDQDDDDSESDSDDDKSQYSWMSMDIVKGLSQHRGGYTEDGVDDLDDDNSLDRNQGGGGDPRVDVTVQGDEGAVSGEVNQPEEVENEEAGDDNADSLIGDDVDWNDLDFGSSYQEMYLSQISYSRRVGLDNASFNPKTPLNTVDKIAIRLLKILKKAKAPLYLYKEVIDWVKDHVTKGNLLRQLLENSQLVKGNQRCSRTIQSCRIEAIDDDD